MIVEDPCACDPASGCKDVHCTLRFTEHLCDPKTCPCQGRCTNVFKPLSHLEVVDFPGKGKGLVTTQIIPDDAFVAEYLGEVDSAKRQDARLDAYKKEGYIHEYVMTVPGGLIVDATKKGGLARFINHSCEPNCVAKPKIKKGKTVLGIFAGPRDIQPGTELTIAYSPTWATGTPGGCRCGAPTCKAPAARAPGSGGDDAGGETESESSETESDQDGDGGDAALDKIVEEYGDGDPETKTKTKTAADGTPAVAAKSRSLAAAPAPAPSPSPAALASEKKEIRAKAAQKTPTAGGDNGPVHKAVCNGMHFLFYPKYWCMQQLDEPGVWYTPNGAFRVCVPPVKTR